MEKLKSSLPNMVGVLVGFSVIIGGLLAYVNHITENPIKHKQEQTLAAGIKTVMQNNNVKVADPVTVKETIDGKTASFIIHPCADNSGKKIGARGRQAAPVPQAILGPASSPTPHLPLRRYGPPALA